MAKQKKNLDQPLNTHTYRCEMCGAEFGVIYMGDGPLAQELQEQTASVIGWHSVTVCGKCAPKEDEEVEMITVNCDEFYAGPKEPKPEEVVLKTITVSVEKDGVYLVMQNETKSFNVKVTITDENAAHLSNILRSVVTGELPRAFITHQAHR